MVRQTELRPGSYVGRGPAKSGPLKSGLAGSQSSEALRQAAFAAIRKSSIRSPARSANLTRSYSPGVRASYTGLPASAVEELAADRARQRRLRISAAIVCVAVLVLLRVIQVHLPKQVAPPLHALQSGTLRRTVQKAGRGSRFAEALNRLNEDLTFTQGMSTEELLREVRESEKSETPVCNFSWNYGQPALLYHSGVPLDRELDQCAEAVEKYVFGKTGQNKPPAENGRGF